MAIARVVGVTDAALFHHFRSMEEMIVAAIDRVDELLFAETTSPQTGPFERLGSFFARRASVMAQNPAAGRLVLSDVLEKVAPPSGVAKVKAYKQRSVAFIRSCLQDARRQGLLAQGFDVPDATVVVFGALMALTQARELVATRGASDDLAVKVWSDIERTLRPKPHRGKAHKTVKEG